MLKHQSLEILDHVSFYWNRFLEATKNVFTEMESFLQSNFPQQFEAVTSKLPSRKKITKLWENDVLKPSRELLQKWNIPEKYENSVIYTTSAIVIIILLFLTYLLIEYAICKPLSWLCCRKKEKKSEQKDKTEESVETKEIVKETEPENARKREKPKKRTN